MVNLAALLNETLNESVYDKGIFKAVFFGGLPGAGKSYTIKNISDGSIQPRVVNFDKYAEFLGKQLGIKDVGGYVEKTFIDRTKQMNISQLALYLNSMLPLFIDSTSNKINRAVYRDGLLRMFGYDTAMVWMNTSLETAIERIRKRDRSVPIEFVKSVHANLEENKNYYQSHFSMFLEINNDDGELTDKVLLEAYRKVSSFFKSDVKNPIGNRNKEAAENSSGYLVPEVYRDINKIKSKLINWY
jgi:predicted kinase